MSPEVPAKFGPYRIVQLLGEGGMGAVYEAVHESIERRVAIKVLRPELAKDPAIATRLFNEARAVNIVDHPAIVQISDYGQLPDGTAYLVMELLHGETLARRLKRLAGSLPLVDTLRISRQIAAALIAAHAKGIVHRDLKPDNLMLVPDPEPDRPGRERLKILDFGIAKVAKEATQAAQGSSDKTRQNLVIGTPLYMSPEQCRGSAAVDEKTDVYALGVILYQMLAQRTPFAGDEIGAILAAQIYEAPPPLLEVAPTVPTAIAMLVHRLLVKDKTLRPTMQQVAEELEVLAHSLRVSSTSYDGVQKAAASSNSGVLGRRASPITQDTVPGDATDDSDLSIPTDASLSADSLAKLGTLPGNISSLPMNSSLAVIETAATLSGAQSIAERAYPTEREVRSAGPTLPLRPGKTPGSGDTGEPRRFPRRLGFILPVAALLLLSGVYFFLRHGSPPTEAQAQALAQAALQSGIHAQAPEYRLLAVQATGRSHDLSQSGMLLPLLADQAMVAPAARALGEIGAISAEPLLLSTLEKTADERVRMEAAAALMQLAHPKGSATLRLLMETGDGAIRIESALRLLEQGDLSGAPLLRRLIDSGTVPVSRMLPVLTVMARAGDEEARQVLSKWAAAPPPQTSEPLFLFGLAKSGDISARNRLSALSGTAGPEQVLSARLLASLGECQGQAVLLRASTDPQKPDAVRELAIEGLADCERADSIAALFGVLTGNASQRLILAAAGTILRLLASAASQIGERALSFSHMALGSDSVATRELAVGLLGDIEGDAAIAPLRLALRDREREVRHGAIRALGKKQVRAALLALEDSLEDADAEVRAAGMRSMGKVLAALRRRGDRDAGQVVFQHLQQMTTSRDEVDRIIASGILWQMGDAAQYEALRTGMEAKNVLIRRLAVEMLDQDRTLLLHALVDSDRSVKLAAARRLSALGATEGKQALRELAAEGNVQGMVAYGVLRQLGETTPEPKNLAERMSNSSVAERTEILEALPDLPAPLALKLLSIASIDSTPILRQRAVEAAADLYLSSHQMEFRSFLSRMRGDPNSGVRWAAEAFLDRLSGFPPAPPTEEVHPPLPPLPAPDLGAAPAEKEVEPGQPAEPATPADAKTKPAAGADSTALSQQILDEAYAAMKSKKYDRVDTLLEQARRLQRHAGKSSVSSEILYLQGMLYELRGQWREAMAAYTRYEKIPSAQRKPQSAQAVAESVARLKPRMGHVLIYTMKNGQCEMTDDYYMPSGEHIISLGGGQSRAVTVEAGGTTPLRQCP